MTVIAASKARATLPEILDRVGRGEEITLTRHGHAVAVILRPDRVRVRRAAAEVALQHATDFRLEMDAAADEPLTTDDLSPEFADDLIASIRADRDRS